MSASARFLEEASPKDVHETEDVYSAKSVSEIRASLAQLQQREATVTERLDKLVSAQKDLQRELARLDLFRANLSTQSAKTRTISNGMLAEAATTASRISGSVHGLDLEQSRVRETLDVVEQVRELKACVLGVAGSMEASKDWETAAGYLSRASKIPNEVIDGEFACRVVPTADIPEAPRVTLQNASETLCGLFQREFDKAVQENDGAMVTRFFKLFPLIGRSEVGLDVYGRYVCQGVAARARQNLHAGTGGMQAKEGLFYATALTKLFEHIAQIVNGHRGLVERHYGPGEMTRVVERLQNEADMQGGIILDTWSDERRIDRHLTDIRSYAYTFLVQSFAPAQRAGVGTPRSDSPAPVRHSEDEGVDMKEVDVLLGELTMMLSKWSLYVRFITQNCTREDENSTVPAFLFNSNLTSKVASRLITPFNTMTTFYFRRSVEKAFQLDEQPGDLNLNPRQPLKSTPPHVSSAIEDVMFIINKILQQTLATCQASVIASVIPALARIMSGDFIGIEQRRMRDEHYPRGVVQDALPPEQTVIAFIVQINNIDVAANYIKQIVEARLDASAQPSLTQLFPIGTEAEAVRATLTSFTSSFSEKAAELLSDANNVMYNNVMKPRLRRILADSFRDVEYNLDAAGLSSLAETLGYDAHDSAGFHNLVASRFAHGWDALTKPIARLMTDLTYTALLSTTATFLSKLLEKRLWTYEGRVNQAGAARLEHDVAGIAKAVVSSGQKTHWKVREMFLRCIQICMVLNMDQEEWEELQQDGSAMDVADKLKPEERTRARAMLIEE